MQTAAGRHANADHVIATVLMSEASVTASVIDDGQGFDESVSAHNRPIAQLGFGMSLMLENIHGLGGAYSIESTPGHGTSVTFAVPLNDVAEPATGRVALGEA